MLLAYADAIQPTGVLDACAFGLRGQLKRYYCCLCMEVGARCKKGFVAKGGCCKKHGAVVRLCRQKKPEAHLPSSRDLLVTDWIGVGGVRCGWFAWFGCCGWCGGGGGGGGGGGWGDMEWMCRCGRG